MSAVAGAGCASGGVGVSVVGWVGLWLENESDQVSLGFAQKNESGTVFNYLSL